MATAYTPEYFWDVVSAHLARRDDFWHIVNGPKREVWFVAECIAALSRASVDHLRTGHRVYGEESYSSLVKNFGGDINSLANDDRRKLPDITIATDYASKLLAIHEAKLCDDFEPANLDADEGHLQYQLDMARPCASSGSGDWRDLDRASPQPGGAGVHTAVNPLRFFEHVSDHAQRVIDFGIYEWCFAERIRPVPGLQNVKPLGGMFNGQASLGIGLIQPRDKTILCNLFRDASRPFQRDGEGAGFFNCGEGESRASSTSGRKAST